jgi:predicted flap endonuclease-1-like 5' DNA nuclease
MAKIIDIEGVGPAYAEKLEAAGVSTVEALLDKGGSSAQRADLAARTGIAVDKILSWVNFADLYRIKGVGSEYSQLLEAAGVDSATELAHRKPENLYAKMVELNTEKKLVRRPPTETQVADWVEQAKKLPKVVTH